MAKDVLDVVAFRLRMRSCTIPTMADTNVRKNPHAVALGKISAKSFTAAQLSKRGRHPVLARWRRVKREGK